MFKNMGVCSHHTPIMLFRLSPVILESSFQAALKSTAQCGSWGGGDREKWGWRRPPTHLHTFPSTPQTAKLVIMRNTKLLMVKR